VTPDLFLPFGILFVLVVYLIYTRTSHEKKVVNIYENKFQEWKKHHKGDEKKESKKELVGLVFKKDGKINIEVFEERTDELLQRGKFSTKVK
jgi:amino acid permease